MPMAAIYRHSAKTVEAAFAGKISASPPNLSDHVPAFIIRLAGDYQPIASAIIPIRPNILGSSMADRRATDCNGQQKPDTCLGSVSIKFPLEFDRGLIAQC